MKFQTFKEKLSIIFEETRESPFDEILLSLHLSTTKVPVRLLKAFGMDLLGSENPGSWDEKILFVKIHRDCVFPKKDLNTSMVESISIVSPDSKVFLTEENKAVEVILYSSVEKEKTLAQFRSFCGRDWDRIFTIGKSSWLVFSETEPDEVFRWAKFPLVKKIKTVPLIGICR